MKFNLGLINSWILIYTEFEYNDSKNSFKIMKYVTLI